MKNVHMKMFGSVIIIHYLNGWICEIFFLSLSLYYSNESINLTKVFLSKEKFLLPVQYFNSVTWLNLQLAWLSLWYDDDDDGLHITWLDWGDHDHDEHDWDYDCLQTDHNHNNRATRLCNNIIMMINYIIYGYYI